MHRVVWVASTIWQTQRIAITLYLSDKTPVDDSKSDSLCSNGVALRLLSRNRTLTACSCDEYRAMLLLQQDGTLDH